MARRGRPRASTKRIKVTHKLTEELTVDDCVLKGIMNKPRENEQSTMAVKVKARATTKLITLLSDAARVLLFDGEGKPRSGFKKLVIDAEKLSNVRVRIRQDGIPPIDVQCEYVSKWAASVKHGLSWIEFDIVCKGKNYLRQWGEFFCETESTAFDMTWSPIQMELIEDQKPATQQPITVQ